MPIRDLTETRTNRAINTTSTAEKEAKQPLGVRNRFSTADKHPSVYICGAVTGHDPDAVYDKFKAAADQWGSKEYVVFNPVELVQRFNMGDQSWEKIMRSCIAWLSCCSTIYCLPCWSQSRGARLERYIAGQLGIKIIDAE
jgi:hypothetical protein